MTENNIWPLCSEHRKSKDGVIMKIGIIGGGSIGLLISSYLCVGHKVTIYVRRMEQKQKINDHGLYLSGNLTPFPVKALLLDEIKKEDYIIICVKQSQVSTILTKINKDDQDTPVVFLQNGMGHIEQFNETNKTVFLGVVEHGALREGDNIVCQTGKGIIKLAAFQEEDKGKLKTFAQQLTQDYFPVKPAAEWRQLLSEKLVINAVINPLTALFHVKNGAILHNPYINELAKELCRESSMVLNLDYFKQWKLVQMVAENTQENISSMLKDIQSHQQTEIEAISGYIIRQSNEQTQIPYTKFVYHAVKSQEMLGERDV